MADGVLLDTSFLISFVDPSRPNHAVAVQYFKFLAAEGLPMFVSTIAVSEFHLRQPVTDLPLDALIILPFNLTDAMRAAELDFTQFKGTQGVTREALKDDFKLLGQVKANDIAFLLTEDERTLFKFCHELKTRRLVPTKPIKLIDGFDTSHFAPGGLADTISDSARMFGNGPRRIITSEDAQEKAEPELF